MKGIGYATCGAVFAKSSRILRPATESVTEGFEPEQPIMLAIRVRKDATGEDEEEGEEVKKRSSGRKRKWLEKLLEKKR